MFVWNAYLTRKIRTTLENTIWTVALVYGFFQQTKCLVSGEEFVLTVIARRSRHYAGTRYLRRGVNNIGRVANDVEIEQIVSKKVTEGQKIPITSIVQVRGSIPLFWSQETSLFNPQPHIIINKKDVNYEATQHHFENLRQRYGKRIIILNLLKTSERETILRSEFAKAIRYINRSVRNENRLKAIHFDLQKHYKSGADDAFHELCIFSRKSLELTDLFVCKAPSGVGAEGVFNESFFNIPLPSQDEEANSPETEALKADILMLQNGVLRTNCIDCLDRTNLAQYAHGLVTLGHQLDTLGIRGPPTVDLNNPLALKLMETYQNMGDTLALQYGGSGAHSKMFYGLRGDWYMCMKHRDIFVALRRHYNNTYQDSEKQNAINVFLGHFRPQMGKPALWELDSDQHNIGKTSFNLDPENTRPLIIRSLSGHFLMNGDLNLEEVGRDKPQPPHERLNGGLSETNSDLQFYETEPGSPSFLSSICCEDHFKGTGSCHVFPGSCSCFDSQRPSDIPGFSHSYNTKFTPAEQRFEHSSSKSWSSSDNMFAKLEESVTCLTKFPSRRRGSDQSGEAIKQELVPGFPNDFTRWIFFGSSL